jgi:hypothetical protein
MAEDNTDMGAIPAILKCHLRGFEVSFTKPDCLRTQGFAHDSIFEALFQLHCAKTGRKKMQKHAHFRNREDEGCGG